MSTHTLSSEAVRLAELLRAAVQTWPQMSEDEPGGYMTEVDQVMDDAAALLRRIPELEGERRMSQHDTLTQALQEAAASLETISRDAGKVDTLESMYQVRPYAANRARAAREALAEALATHPAQAQQSEPVKPLFAAKVAARKWAELQAEGARMESIAFDGHKSGQPGTIDAWGVVQWGAQAQQAGEVVKDALLHESSRWDRSDHRLAVWEALRVFGSRVGVTITRDEQYTAHKAGGEV